MARNYKSIGKEIALTGFFSEYLPPCFSLNSKVLFYPPPADCDLIKPLGFTMSRYNANDSRRTIFIPEIGSYLSAHMFMSENNIYKELIQFTQTENYSFSPILGENSSIMRHEQSYEKTEESPTSEYIKNISDKLIRSAGAKKILRLDISNCYSSFYMHMIPAIMLGTEIAEAEYDKSLKRKIDPSIVVDPQYDLYSKLDEVIRRQNLNRTNGLLPGILSSKMIAEALLTRIDKELSANKINFVRYVDDYEVFLYESNEEAVISVFTRILRKYGFTLNFEKNQIVDFPFYIVENFEKILNKKLEDEIDSSELIDIFNRFLLIEKSGTKGAVRYLLKSLEKYDVRVEKPLLYKSYLLTIMSNEPRSLSKACSILISGKEKYGLLPSDKKTIINMLSQNIKNGNDLETVWLLYLLIETNNLSKGDSIVIDLLNSSSELTWVMLLRKQLLNDSELDLLKERADSWIMLYELYQGGYINESTFVQKLNLNKNISMYQKFKEKGIHFVY